ncbi:homoserine O-acetyltransferase [Bowmanella sp. Y26]|nr:homoserine O-acetyltransferase [Bowmanella yangjiangensis]
MRLTQGKWWIALMLLLHTQCFASELLTQKQRFELPEFTTFGGKTIKQLQVGYESYGSLNADKSNVILITHFFSGSSHAAGKYQPDDATPGYWDAIIGPGKAIDTNKFFVLSVDTLVNFNAHDPNVITTGPATINPDTGKPWGLAFPVVTIRDFVNVQKALLESMGITKLYAVAGPSMGSMQALEWATTYPDWIPRMISVIGAGQSDAWTVAALEQWGLPIKVDPNWNQGNYYQGEPPLAGLTTGLMLLTQQALYPDFINSSNPQHQSLEEAPLADIHQSHQVVNWLRNMAAARAKVTDANHVLYLIRASQLFLAGQDKPLAEAMQQVKAKTLFIPASHDLLLMPYLAEQPHQALLQAGKNSTLVPIVGPMGHLDGVANISQVADQIQRFLMQD